MTPSQKPFLFRSELSLECLIAYWRDAAADASSPEGAVARLVLEQWEEAPALHEPIPDPDALAPHRALIDLMMSAIVPSALRDDVFVCAMTPFKLEPFFETPALQRLQLFEQGCPSFIHTDLSADHHYAARALRAYYWILEECYGVTNPLDFPLLFAVRDEEQGLRRHFRVDIDPRFAVLHHEEPLPALSQEALDRMLADPLNLPLWMELLPPEAFSFRGFLLMTAFDVTDQQVVSDLKNDLLRPEALTSSAHVDYLEDRLRTFLRCPSVRLGLIRLERDDIDNITSAQPIGRSLLLDGEGAPSCPCRAESYYAQAFDRHEPLVVDDLARAGAPSAYEQRLLDAGYRSFLLAPLRFEDTLIGLLELASPTPGAINAMSGLRLAEVLALFALAMKRTLDEQEDRIQAAIKENYTAIHPSIEWRFREAAQRLLERQATDRRAQIEPIVFPEVYPLYGLSDIRGSSSHRNESIRQDLKEQLGLALAVVIEATSYRPLPILDEVSFRIERYIRRLAPDVTSEDEGNVLDFLRSDVESLFPQLETFGSRVRRRVEEYRETMDPELGVLYHRRKDFEDGITLINDTISAFIDEQQVYAQSMFPHYFEKYKTDGVDYNIYVGQSLLERHVFDPLYLHNLRLWQLMMMCGVVWEMEELRPQLKTPLDTTHLILVQSAPLSIRFRMEEKQFDVDGAYNIRYEIVKKRIDKATVQGTGERLTQPGQIAIVYAQAKESWEYLRYINYLEAAGYLTGDVERFNLSDMQGVYGLKALRVTVNPRAPEADVHVTFNGAQEVLEAVSG